MTELFVPTLLLLIAGGVGVRLWVRAWREQRMVARRRVEEPKSHYSSLGVRHQEDRERWGRIDIARLHPLNGGEVARLLEVVDSAGVATLSPRERLFLDNMARPRHEA